MHRHAILALLALSACDALGPKNCTLLYAADHVQVDIDSPDEPWDEGEWTIEAGGESCTIDLATEEVLDCSGSILLEPDDGRLASFQVTEQAPDSLQVVLLHNGVEVLNETVTPSYTSDEPNGPGCGVRDMGEAEVVMP